MSKLSSYSKETVGIVTKKQAKGNSVLSKLRLKPQASTIKIVVNDNKIEIQNDGYFICMDIKYTGDIVIDYNSVPEGWVVNQGIGRILIYAFSDKDTPDFVFNYNQAIKIYKAEWANAVDEKKYAAEIVNEQMNYWNTIKSKWNETPSTYNNLTSSSKESSRISYPKTNKTRMIPRYKGERNERK